MDEILDSLSWLLLTAGGLFVLIGGIGALRMPTFYARLHASSLTDSGGTSLVLIGLMLQAGFTLDLVKLGAVLVFMALAGPTATYALANAALLGGVPTDAEEYAGGGGDTAEGRR